jgi:membrane protein DedA with SNARE-associated domain
MFPSDAEIMQFFAQYAHSPGLIYTILCVVMLLSSFGLPLPEEVSIIALGLIVYMGRNPDLYPPAPGVEHQSLNLYTAMFVCTMAIFLSDYLVYYIGKRFGDSPFLHRTFRRYLGEHSLERARMMVHKYRFWVPAVFRFTPGVRFPGHLSCGMMGIKPTTFILADGLAALISVPTQVYLFAIYGEVILSTIKEVKHYIFIAGAVALVVYLCVKLRYKFFGPKTKTNMPVE